MIPDWVLSLQASASCARRLNMSKDFEWDEELAQELAEAAYQLESLLSEQEGIYDECMENTKLN